MKLLEKRLNCTNCVEYMQRAMFTYLLTLRIALSSEIVSILVVG